jgi:hypothetical protein
VAHVRRLSYGPVIRFERRAVLATAFIMPEHLPGPLDVVELLDGMPLRHVWVETSDEPSIRAAHLRVGRITRQTEGRKVVGEARGRS